MSVSRKARSLFWLAAACALLTSFAISPSTRAESTPLDETPSKEAPPKQEKKAITVAPGTPMMVKTGTKISSESKAGSNFSATLEANLMSGDEVVAKQGSQVYGQVLKSGKVGRGIVVQHADLVLGLTQINIEGTMYPIQTSSYSQNSTGVILQRGAVVIPAGSLLEFKLTQPVTVKK